RFQLDPAPCFGSGPHAVKRRSGERAPDPEEARDCPRFAMPCMVQPRRARARSARLKVPEIEEFVMRFRRIVQACAALALAFGASAASAQERITIGTGGTAGLFYVIGAGMAEVINKHLPNATARAEVTG